MKEKLEADGYAVIENVLTATHIQEITRMMKQVDDHNANFRRSADLFAVRKFLQEVPPVLEVLKESGLFLNLSAEFGENYFIVKSIYFDKPAASNWFVAYHQDLTISVAEKIETAGFGPWTVKPGQFAVQPPAALLEDNFTLRIHLDDTTLHNGALRVIAGSHKNGVCRTEHMQHLQQSETSVDVGAGGMMLMKPLLLHASGRTTNNKPRRVIHLELSRTQLPHPLRWSEAISIN